MNTTLIQAFAAIAFAAVTPMLAAADSQEVKQLPLVVITGKSQPVGQQVVQLPRVVIVGRSSTAMALNSIAKPTAHRA